MPLKILAIADTHATATMRLGGTSPTENGRPLVLVQTERMFAWAAEVARREKVDLIMHAGDVYECPNPKPAAEAVVVDAMLRFSSVAPTVVIPGNHDRSKGGGVHALEPLKNIAPGRLFIADTPDPVHLVHAHDRGGARLLTLNAAEWDAEEIMLTVFPLPFPELGRAARGHGDAKAAVSHALTLLLEQHAIAARKCTHPTAVLFHGTMTGASFNDYQTAPMGDVGVSVGGLWSAFDVQAAGHLHRRQLAPGLRLSGYIGAPDRHDFGEELESAGVSVFTIEEEDGARWVDDDLVHYPDARQFVTLDVSSGEGAKYLAKEIGTYFPDGVSGHFVSGDVEPTRAIYRLKGRLSPVDAQRAAALARALRARGWIIANKTTVERSDRSRVRFEAEAISSRSKILEAVFVASPELAKHQDRITSDLDEVWAD